MFPSAGNLKPLLSAQVLRALFVKVSPDQTVPAMHGGPMLSVAAATGADRVTIPIIGITGTDGKTTTNWLAWQLIGKGAARVGTLGFHDGQEASPSRHTMPPADEMMPFIAGLPATCPGLVLELSSHGLDQHRLAGVSLQALAITNIGRDHLDYHGSFTHYVEAKLRAVELVKPGGLVVINADDDMAPRFAQAAEQRGCRVLAIGFMNGNVRLVREDEGWRLRSPYADHPLPVPMPGAMNAWNAAAAVFVSQEIGIPMSTACARLADAQPAPGRLQKIMAGPNGPTAYVDFAHTPLALERVLAALRIEHRGQKLVVVIGCGGDRDQGKRPLMGSIAGQADVAIITDDNPRSENPAM